MTDPAQVLNKISQVAESSWCDSVILKEFVDNISAACEYTFKAKPQNVFCPCGQPHKVNWQKKEHFEADYTA
jgi:hypothetical protein